MREEKTLEEVMDIDFTQYSAVLMGCPDFTQIKEFPVPTFYSFSFGRFGSCFCHLGSDYEYTQVANIDGEKIVSFSMVISRLKQATSRTLKVSKTTLNSCWNLTR